MSRQWLHVCYEIKKCGGYVDDVDADGDIVGVGFGDGHIHIRSNMFRNLQCQIPVLYHSMIMKNSVSIFRLLNK